MARPKKIGLDYFPIDTNIDLDDKIQLIEAEFGIKGFAIIIKLFCKMYSDKGYYYKWTEVERLLFAKRTGESVGLVDNIVKRSVKWGIFDDSLFNQFQILTSEAIQSRFLDAIKRRDSVDVITDFVLFDVNDYKNEVNVNINLVNVNNNPQSKVEESRVKESKEDNNSSKDPDLKKSSAKKNKSKTKNKAPKNKVEKEEKGGAKKEEKTKVQKAYTGCVDIWLKDIHPDFDFRSIDGKKMKSIVKKIEKRVKKKSDEYTEN